jgi:hypothetical protein
MKRKPIPKRVKLDVLTEAGYQCAVPTCRTILSLDIHHIDQVSEGGGNDLTNLIALCPTHHDMYHKKLISKDSIYAWKLMLVSLSRAFDTNTVDDLLFLNREPSSNLQVSGDGVLKFSRLIGSGLAEFKLKMQNGPIVLYQVGLTKKGAQLVDAWVSGNRENLALALGKPKTPKKIK